MIATPRPTGDSILIVDFGSQVTQLIARRVREAGVYCEIAPFNSAEAALRAARAEGLILSGGPSSVTEENSPRAPQSLFDGGLPILGICYGQQVMATSLAAPSRPATPGKRGGEFGRAFLDRRPSPAPCSTGCGRSARSTRCG